MKKCKKLLCLFLAGIMILALAACGKDETGGEGGKGGAGGEGGKNVADSGLSKQNVFRGQTIELGEEFNNINLYSMICKDNRIFMIVEDYNNSLGGATVVGRTEGVVMMPAVDSEIAVMPEVGDDVVIDDEIPMEDVYYGPAYYLVSMNMDGSDKKQQELKMDTTGTGWMSNIKLLSDGSVVGFREESYEDLADPENPVYRANYTLYKWDSEGNSQWNTKVNTNDDEYLYAQAIVEDKDGNLVMITGENKLYLFDKNGKEVAKKEIAQGTDYISQVITKKDGSIFVTSYNDDWTKMFVSKLDVNAATIGDKVEMPSTLNGYSFFPGETSDFILSNNQGLYTYNIGDSEPVMFMNYINSDVESYNLFNVNMLNDKEFIATYNDMTEWTLKLAKFTYVDPATIPDRITLVVGCTYLDSNLKKRIIDFNKSSDKYRFTIKDYSVYNTMEDYTQAQTQMNNDIISGKMPDIMLLETAQDISSWANKGLLADVEELIAKDPELSKNEYLDNVFKAFSVNDKLYTVVPSYSIQTMVARKDVVGVRDGWTMTEFEEFMKSQPKDVKPFGDDMVRDTVMYNIMQYCGSDFVDVNTGNCSFDSQEFIAMLEFANSFPEEYDPSYWEDYDWMAMQGMYRDKKAVMMSTYIYSMQDMVYTLKGNLGDEAVFVGFPGLSGNSSIIVPNGMMMVLSAKSKNLDGAWELVRYYLTEEYQTGDQMWGLPVLKKALTEQAKKSMERPYWINEETGEKEYYDHTYWINEEEIILDPFSQQEADAICDFICSVDKPYYYNESITNIVLEEAGSYFAGSKSAKDVAQVIQSRVQLYVDENR